MSFVYYFFGTQCIYMYMLHISDEIMTTTASALVVVVVVFSRIVSRM